MKPDSLSYLSRAVSHVFNMFYCPEDFRDGYMPGKFNAPPNLYNNKKIPVENYQVLYQIFMHILGFQSTQDYDESEISRQIFATTQNFRSRNFRESLSKEPSSGRKKRAYDEDRDWTMSDEDENDQGSDRDRSRRRREIRPITDHGNQVNSSSLGNRSDINANEPFTFQELEGFKNRLENILSSPYEVGHAGKSWFTFKTEARVYSLKLFNDEYLDDMFQELLVRSDSTANLSGCSLNVARVLWTKEDVGGKRIRNYKHRAKFDSIFMHLFGYTDKQSFTKTSEYYRILQRLVTISW